MDGQTADYTIPWFLFKKRGDNKRNNVDGNAKTKDMTLLLLPPTPCFIPTLFKITDSYLEVITYLLPEEHQKLFTKYYVSNSTCEQNFSVVRTNRVKLKLISKSLNLMLA